MTIIQQRTHKIMHIIMISISEKNFCDLFYNSINHRWLSGKTIVTKHTKLREWLRFESNRFTMLHPVVKLQKQRVIERVSGLLGSADVEVLRPVGVISSFENLGNAWNLTVLLSLSDSI